MSDPEDRKDQPGTALVPIQLPDPTAIAAMDDDGKHAVLETCEEIITRSSIWKGMALAYIKKHKLYEQLNYKTWQDYLKDRWEGLSRSYAHRLIQAAEAVKGLDASLQAREMLPVGNSVATVVRTEREARDLRGHEHEVIRLVDKGKSLDDAVPEVVLKVRRENEQKADGSGQVRLGPDWRRHLGPPTVIVPDPDPEDEAITELAVDLKLLFEKVRDLSTSRARTLLQPFESDLLEFLDVLGYDTDTDQEEA